jgi:hypothetical protein
MLNYREEKAGILPATLMADLRKWRPRAFQSSQSDKPGLRMVLRIPGMKNALFPKRQDSRSWVFGSLGEYEKKFLGGGPGEQGLPRPPPRPPSQPPLRGLARRGFRPDLPALERALRGWGRECGGGGRGPPASVARASSPWEPLPPLQSFQDREKKMGKRIIRDRGAAPGKPAAGSGLPPGFPGSWRRRGAE